MSASLHITTVRVMYLCPDSCEPTEKEFFSDRVSEWLSERLVLHARKDQHIARFHRGIEDKMGVEGGPVGQVRFVRACDTAYRTNPTESQPTE